MYLKIIAENCHDIIKADGALEWVNTMQPQYSRRWRKALTDDDHGDHPYDE